MAEAPAASGFRDPRSGSEAVAHENPRSGSEAVAHENPRSGSEAVARENPRSGSEAVARQDTIPIRRCAFCDAPFTARMQAWMGESAGCACCGGVRPGHWPIKAPVRDTDELVCESCGKVLYRAT